MKTFLKLTFTVISLLVLQQCQLPEVPDEGEKSEDFLGSGTVLSNKNRPIGDANVTIIFEIFRGEKSETGERKGFTDKEGRFSIQLPKANKYIVNVTKTGLGLSSKVFQDSEELLDTLPDETYYLTQATVQEINAEEGGRITVTQTESAGTLSSKAKWDQSPTGSLPIVVDNSGKISSFIMPDQLKQAWDLQVSNNVQLSATSLTIRPNSLVNNAGKPASGKVSVAISAVDLFAPGGMPGNNIATDAQGATGPMQSFGAFTVEIYDEEQSYNLNSEKEATALIEMPIPEWQLRRSKEFPRSVPILFYNEETGVWEEDGKAIYDEKVQGYVGEVSHFSSINFDIIKTGPSTNAAFTFNITSPTPQPFELGLPFHVEVTTEDAATNQLFVRTRTIDLTNGGNALCEFASVPVPPSSTQITYGISMNRLPINSKVAVTFFNDPINPVAKALYVLETNSGSLDITSDPWGTPNCNDIETNVYSNSTFVNPQQFIDQIIPDSSPDTLVAMCLEGSNYRVSIASRDLSFDAQAGLILNFNKILGAPGDTPCPSYQDLTDISSPFTEILKTPAGPPSNPEWIVQVFEVPIISLCDDPTITGFNVQLSAASDPPNVLREFGVEIGSCIF